MIRKGNTITLDFVWGLVGAPILFTVSPVTESDRTIPPWRTRSSPTHCISCLANFWVVRALNSRSPIPRRRGDIVGNLNWNQATRTHTRMHAHTHTLAPPPVWVSTHARMNARTRTHTHTGTASELSLLCGNKLGNTGSGEQQNPDLKFEVGNFDTGDYRL